MLKHLLVPLDGSELSERAILVALQGLDIDGTLTLLTVVDLPVTNFVLVSDMPPIVAAHDNTEKVLPEARKTAQAYLQDVVERVQFPLTVKLNTEVYTGYPATVIAERAQALHVDAIVMCTHGRSGLSRLWFGSVAQRVLGLMPCPVLVVPDHVAEKEAATTLTKTS